MKDSATGGEHSGVVVTDPRYDDEPMPVEDVRAEEREQVSRIGDAALDPLKSLHHVHALGVEVIAVRIVV